MIGRGMQTPLTVQSYGSVKRDGTTPTPRYQGIKYYTLPTRKDYNRENILNIGHLMLRFQQLYSAERKKNTAEKY